MIDSSQQTPKQASEEYASLEKKAKARANAKLGFAIHLTVFGIITSISFIQGLFAGNPFSAVAGFMGWGIGVFWHGFAVFKPSLIKRLTKQELEKEMKSNDT